MNDGCIWAYFLSWEHTSYLNCRSWQFCDTTYIQIWRSTRFLWNVFVKWRNCSIRTVRNCYSAFSYFKFLCISHGNCRDRQLKLLVNSQLYHLLTFKLAYKKFGLLIFVLSSSKITRFKSFGLSKFGTVVKLLHYSLLLRSTVTCITNLFKNLTFDTYNRLSSR